MKPMLTFIIPCYNVEKYVENCVNSIIKQHYESLEIYLMDDGSNDSTKEKCFRLSQENENVYLIENNSNIGVIEVRNKILNYISKNNTYENRWICFLDSDDEIMNESLHKIGSVLENKASVDFLVTGIQFVYQDCYKVEVPKIPMKEYSGHEIAYKVCNDLSWSIVSCMGNKFYKFKFIEENGLRFRKCFVFNEDGGFAVEAFTCANSIYFLDMPFYKYYQRKGSAMHSYREDSYFSVKNVIDELKKYFNEKEIDGNAVIARKRINLIYDSLLNELAYKHRDRFSGLFIYIRSEQDSIETCRFILKSKKFRFSEKVKAFLILFNMKYIMEMFIYISILKSKRKVKFTDR